MARGTDRTDSSAVVEDIGLELRQVRVMSGWEVDALGHPPSTRPEQKNNRRLQLRKRTLKYGTWNTQGSKNKSEEIIKEI